MNMPPQCPAPGQGFRFFRVTHLPKGEIVNLDTNASGPLSRCLCPSDKVSMSIPLDERHYQIKDLAKLSLAHLYGTEIAAALADRLAVVIEDSMDNNGSFFSTLWIHKWAVDAWQDLQNENSPAPR